MGFLDHSTNNIIVDAVLTDRGRELLAAQNGNDRTGFKIEKFSLSDDEVDYTIIQKYGRTVGKEKIIKNTPVFEAQTKAYLAQKFRMVTLNDPLVTHLPSLDVSPAGILTFSTATPSTTVRVKTVMSEGKTVPVEIVDNEFYVILPSKLLAIGSTAGTSQTPLDIDESTSLLTATYVVTTAANNPGQNTTIVDFALTRLTSIDDTLFTVYGTGGSIIKTVISIIGADSGARKDISISITR